MRLDKYINDCLLLGRSQIKKDIKSKLVTINGTIATDGGQQINESSDVISYKGEIIVYQKFHYYMLHKPAGVVTAKTDSLSPTVMDLLPDTIPWKSKLNPVGRLDKDTEGLLLITDDGPLAHALLAPAKHVDKTYYCKVREGITDSQLKALQNGVDIGEDKDTLPAIAAKISDYELQLTIHEGKFHQVKRMLLAVGNEVLYLKRLSMGSLVLDQTLESGCYRELTVKEIADLQDISNSKSNFYK